MRARSHAPFLAAVLLLAALPAVAQVPLGGEFRVNTYTSGDQGNPAVAAHPDGGFVVVWSSYYGVRPGIFGQRYDNQGAAIGGEFQINTTTTDDERDPDISRDAAGNFVVVWTQFSFTGPAGEIRARRFASNGSPLGPDFLVNVYTSGLQRHPSVASAPNGDFVIAWDDGFAPGAQHGQDGTRASRRWRGRRTAVS
jgi:hypothetical protein